VGQLTFVVDCGGHLTLLEGRRNSFTLKPWSSSEVINRQHRFFATPWLENNGLQRLCGVSQGEFLNGIHKQYLGHGGSPK